jgi:uncharacterized membrane protein YhiD involved in acid resistance
MTMDPISGTDAASAAIEGLKVFLLQLTLAAALGAVLAFHLSYVRSFRASKWRRDTAKAQVLLCVAGTLLVLIIGDSMARAFGIFGVGSFFRFRAQVRGLFEAACMVILLGIGMAVGVGEYAIAVAAAVFVYAVIAAMHLFPNGRSDRDRHDERTQGDELVA